MHRPFMEQRSYFKSGLEIENKLDHARPLLKMICKDKWKRLERKLKKKTKHETTRALGLQRETGQGTGEGKERSDNQMPKRRRIRKPVQDSKSRITELTGKTAESAPFCAGSPSQSSRHRNAEAETKKQICWSKMGCAENKPNPLVPNPLSGSQARCNIHPALPHPPGMGSRQFEPWCKCRQPVPGQSSFSPHFPTPFLSSLHTPHTILPISAYIKHGLKRWNCYAALISVE